MGYLFKTHLKPKSHEILFAHSLFISNPIFFLISTEYGSDTAMLYAIFQSDWTTETDVMNEQNFMRFKFKVSSGRKSYISQHPWMLNLLIPWYLGGIVYMVPCDCFHYTCY